MEELLFCGLRQYLPDKWRNTVSYLTDLEQNVEEIRFSIGRPVLCVLADKEIYLGINGIIDDISQAPLFTADDMHKLVLLLSDSSFYALEEELRRGYITLPGGHRAGLSGRVVLERGMVKTIRDISSVNIRIARYVAGAAEAIGKYILAPENQIYQTLLVSPPRAGKTTMLRDIAVALSDGRWSKPRRVGMVDERSELAAMIQGIPQLPVGVRTDVMDGCPKAEGLMMLLRSMSPEVLICDELGRNEDAVAIAEAGRAGVPVVASAHGASLEELSGRPVLNELIRKKDFNRIIFLSRTNGPGTIEEVFDENLTPIKSNGGMSAC